MINYLFYKILHKITQKKLQQICDFSSFSLGLIYWPSEYFHPHAYVNSSRNALIVLVQFLHIAFCLPLSCSGDIPLINIRQGKLMKTKCFGLNTKFKTSHRFYSTEKGVL